MTCINDLQELQESSVQIQCCYCGHFTFRSCHSGASEMSTGLVSAILGATAVALMMFLWRCERFFPRYAKVSRGKEPTVL